MTPIKSRVKQYPETIHIYKEQTFLVLPKINSAGIWHSKNIQKIYNNRNNSVFEEVFFSIIVAIILRGKKGKSFIEQFWNINLGSILYSQSSCALFQWQFVKSVMFLMQNLFFESPSHLLPAPVQHLLLCQHSGISHFSPEEYLVTPSTVLGMEETHPELTQERTQLYINGGPGRDTKILVCPTLNTAGLGLFYQAQRREWLGKHLHFLWGQAGHFYSFHGSKKLKGNRSSSFKFCSSSLCTTLAAQSPCPADCQSPSSTDWCHFSHQTAQVNPRQLSRGISPGFTSVKRFQQSFWRQAIPLGYTPASLKLK